MCKQPGTKRNCRHYTLASHRTLSSRAPSLSWLDTESPLTRVQFWLGCLGRHASRFFIASLYRQVAESTTHPWARANTVAEQQARLSGRLYFSTRLHANSRPQGCCTAALHCTALHCAALQAASVQIGRNHDCFASIGAQRRTCGLQAANLVPVPVAALPCCRDLRARVRCDCAALSTQRWSEAVG